MANKEMYDYLAIVVPDYSTTTLSLLYQKIITEEAAWEQTILVGDDESESVITHYASPKFNVTLGVNTRLSEDIGTIFDFYCDANKAKGNAKSFKWQHPTDGHIYVAKFRDTMRRIIRLTNAAHEIERINLKIIGRIADA